MKNLLIKIIVLIIVGYLGVNLVFKYAANSRASQEARVKEFVVESGESVKKIAQNLASEGLVKSNNWFEIYVWQKDLGTKLQAGKYSFKPNMTVQEIAGYIASGRSVSREREIKMIEGWNINDIDAYLAKEGLIQAGEYKKMTSQAAVGWAQSFSLPDYMRGLPAGAGLEGYLFPDTYRVYNDASVGDIINKQLENLQNKISKEMIADINSQNRSVYEVLTLASVIEKEVRSAEDMKIVAGIFSNRLESGQPLESCATLAYILGVNKPVYSLDDTKIVSPYNTYQNRGLPPGPICNPGLEAIYAAVYPEETDYNYFLSRPDTGGTVFSKTYDEHLANKDKYLRQD